MPLVHKILNEKKLLKLTTTEILEIKKDLDKRCVMCREEISEDEYTVEHIFPQWLLRKFNLWDQYIELPNNMKIKYNKMTVPCCKTCNGGIMSEYENIIKKGVEGGYDEFIKIKENIIAWWIYKIYYTKIVKETTMKYDVKNPNSKKIIEEEFINNNQFIYLYMVELLKDTKFSKKPYELYIFKSDNVNDFDYIYFEETHSIFMRINDIVIVCCLDSYNLFSIQYRKEISLLENKNVSNIEAAELLIKIHYYRLHYAFDTEMEYVIDDKYLTLLINIINLKQIREFNLSELYCGILKLFIRYGIEIPKELETYSGQMITFIR